eukprot:2973261-Karenia_brevis.AAC.1
MVLASLSNGLQGGTVFRHDTPLDVLIWLKNWHNKFHHGSKPSFLEVLEYTDWLSTQWAVYADKEGITARAGKGENSTRNLCWTWIQKQEDDVNSMGNGDEEKADLVQSETKQRTSKQPMLKSMIMYENCKAFNNQLQRYGCSEMFHAVFGTITNFNEPRLVNEVVLSNLHHWGSVLSTHFEDYMDREDLKMLLMEGSMFIVPVTFAQVSGDDVEILANCSGRDVEWLFCQNVPQHKKLDWPTTKMDDNSILVKRAKEGPAATEMAKKKAKKEVEPPKNQAIKDAASGFNQQTMMKSMKGKKDGAGAKERYKQWLDTVYHLIKVSYDSTGEDILEAQEKKKAKLVLYSACLEFCWKKILVFNLKKHTCWSSLNTDMLDAILSNKVKLQASADSSSDDKPQSQVARLLLASIGSANDSAVDATPTKLPTAVTKLVVFLESEAGGQMKSDIKQFLQKNPMSRPAKYHPAMNDILG